MGTEQLGEDIFKNKDGREGSQMGAETYTRTTYMEKVLSQSIEGEGSSFFEKEGEAVSPGGS